MIVSFPHRSSYDPMAAWDAAGHRIPTMRTTSIPNRGIRPSVLGKGTQPALVEDEIGFRPSRCSSSSGMDRAVVTSPTAECGVRTVQCNRNTSDGAWVRQQDRLLSGMKPLTMTSVPFVVMNVRQPHAYGIPSASPHSPARNAPTVGARVSFRTMAGGGRQLAAEWFTVPMLFVRRLIGIPWYDRSCFVLCGRVSFLVPAGMVGVLMHRTMCSPTHVSNTVRRTTHPGHSVTYRQDPS